MNSDRNFDSEVENEIKMMKNFIDGIVYLVNEKNVEEIITDNNLTNNENNEIIKLILEKIKVHKKNILDFI